MDAVPAAAGAREKPEIGLLRLTWPIFFELFLFMLMGTADTLMLSGVSDDAVSAVGAITQIVMICILITGVVGHGAAIVVAQYLGARRDEEASKIAALSITMCLALGVLVSLVLLVFGDSILRALNLQGAVLAHATTYLHIVGGFIFLQALIHVLSSIIRTYGFTKESMFVSMGMNVLHVLLNYGFIFGNFGLPELGVTGAAISTVLSRTAALIVFVWMSYRVMTVRMAPRFFVTFTKEYSRKILSVGVPSAVEQLIYQSCQMVFLYYVTFLGSVALASRQYAMTVSQYIFLFSLAVGMGTSILVARLVGAGRPEDAYRRAIESLKWSIGITVLVDVGVILLRERLVGLFTQEPSIVLLTSQVLVLSLFLESGRSFNLVLVNGLRASGDARFPVMMGLLSMVCMSLPLGFLLVFRFNMGLPGVWIAIAADEWTRGIVMWLRWRSRAWQKQALVTGSVPA
ncbi:MAG: MATE family efflux transporter [Myxococcaceae bacterium]